ncbi:hypothetical protein AVEN_16825-1 [Araneus ventricosus]|uniref:Uncharacterized protein n=1 Tax=Araneus ventricosus TaxID=182803 RepID=A0A4Y2BQH9_ARAVE|nr:hypothetical protein AVEN_16825-1 [Araneus ventricosus]
MENFCGVSFSNTEQHVEARLSRVIRNNNYCKKCEDWFICHNPFQVGEYLISLSAGVVRDEKVNCHPDRNGHSSMESIARSNFGQVKFSWINRVVPMKRLPIM